ncbi:hypothetical protein [Mesorhizobium sp. WSM4982]|uniref:hypothetical protein n=1 Tax=Mesorhizobium sp. WSM4982 TaxID=3038550 RepID=UPI002415399D|nr:hypothetical protein [Mesorhizobium sp. WSM4982]MDG4856394.1 hypothetical protein [Mesorhizobium sp. WSM4982]
MPNTTRMKMYRGHSSQIWRERFVAKGWPLPQATAMANFLVGLTDLPTWQSLLDPAAVGEALIGTLGADTAAKLRDWLDRELP